MLQKPETAVQGLHLLSFGTVHLIFHVEVKSTHFKEKEEYTHLCSQDTCQSPTYNVHVHVYIYTYVHLWRDVCMYYIF